MVKLCGYIVGLENFNKMLMIKNNRFIRGLYYLLKQTFGFRRKYFGYLHPSASFTPPYYVGNPKNVYIYSRDSIGCNCFISGTNAKLIIKKGCVIAEGFTVHTGNHARIIGKFINEVSESMKPQGYDADVIINEDVWIGCNVTILSGVTIGRGATIAAGAVVNQSLPPYSICGGVPAKPIKFYWNVDQILEHESKLYSKEERYTREYLKEISEKFMK